MKLELIGRPWDAATEATVRAALAPLAVSPVTVLYAMRFDSAPTGTCRAWARLEDGRECSVKSVRGPCEMPADELPEFLLDVRQAIVMLTAAG